MKLEILNHLCGELKIDKAEITSSRRTEELSFKRKIIALCLKHPSVGMSYSDIARVLNKHHSSIMNMVKKATYCEVGLANHLVKKYLYK